MKISELIKSLQHCESEQGGDFLVSIETGDKTTGRRIEQVVFDVLLSNRVLLVSKEANELDPLNSLPVCDSDGDEIPKDFN